MQDMHPTLDERSPTSSEVVVLSQLRPSAPIGALAEADPVSRRARSFAAISSADFASKAQTRSCSVMSQTRLDMCRLAGIQ